MELATRVSEELARYLDLSTRQMQLTSANMANIDTPGYRAVGMDFEGEVKRALAEVDGADGGDTGHMGLPGTPGPRIFAEDGLIVRPDGNNVSMDRESLDLAEAQLRFKTGVALLKREYTRIFDAIHADAK